MTVSLDDLSALTAALESVQYDGGTQLGAIEPIPGAGKPDFYLLFTDGISNFGSEEPARLDAPLYIFSADAGANHALLHSLAMSNGGRYFNLANWKDADIFAQAGKPAWSFLSAKIDGGEAADLYPQRPQPLAGRFTLVGKLTGETATVTADYGIAGGKPDKQTFKVSRSDAASGSLLQRLWAGKKLAELMIHQKPNEHEIAALGKKFNLVTPYTSLLVLDSLEQYVRYDIAPPKSLPAMREEYMRRIDTIEHQKQKEKADKVEQVVRMWQERVNWWTNEYKYPKDFKYCGPGGTRGTDGGAAPRARQRQGHVRRRGRGFATPLGRPNAKRRRPQLPRLRHPRCAARPAAEGRSRRAQRGSAVIAGIMTRRDATASGAAYRAYGTQASVLRKIDRDPGPPAGHRHPAVEPRHALSEGLARRQGQGRATGRLHEEPRPVRHFAGLLPRLRRLLPPTERRGNVAASAQQHRRAGTGGRRLAAGAGPSAGADRRTGPGRADLRAGAGVAARGAAVVSRPGPDAGPPGRRGGQGPFPPGRDDPRRLRAGRRSARAAWCWAAGTPASRKSK